MTRNVLKNELDKAGVPEYLYNLSESGRKDERLCLENREKEWIVYYLERGVRTTEEIFKTEEEACEYIYSQLLRKRHSW